MSRRLPRSLLASAIAHVQALTPANEPAAQGADPSKPGDDRSVFGLRLEPGSHIRTAGAWFVIHVPVLDEAGQAIGSRVHFVNRFTGESMPPEEVDRLIASAEGPQLVGPDGAPL